MEPTNDFTDSERRAFEHIFGRPPDGWMHSDARAAVRLLAVEMERDDLRAEVERLKAAAEKRRAGVTAVIARYADHLCCGVDADILQALD